MNTTQELQNKVSALESQVDHLETELSYINDLLLRCGFPHGIQTLKITIEQMLEEGGDNTMPDLTEFA
ncbi:MAG: hypothetical protein JSR58_07705 [Verrucomicrobia bacterium]|nr:hypothetical protein [Verrucomicrobiota bacterium]